MENIFVGTELKLNINIQPINDLTMDDYDFKLEIYCSPSRVVTIEKKDTIKVDRNNFVAVVDTNIIKQGTLKVRIIAYIPDTDCEDKYRTEVIRLYTNINLIK